jgi:hypothetical protein
MLVRDLQQVLGQFTDKFNKGMGKVEGKGNAIMYAKVYVDLGNGRLSEIQKIEAHENTLIGATEGVRVVLKTLPPSKSKIMKNKENKYCSIYGQDHMVKLQVLLEC